MNKVIINNVSKYKFHIIFVILILAMFIFYLIKYSKRNKGSEFTEGLEPMNEKEMKIKFDFASSFCDEANKVDTISKCGSLTNKNCNATSCCVWTKDKCVPGDASGPTFNTDENGKTKDIDYYYYKNKCYGNKC